MGGGGGGGGGGGVRGVRTNHPAARGDPLFYNRITYFHESSRI